MNAENSGVSAQLETEQVWCPTLRCAVGFAGAGSPSAPWHLATRHHQRPVESRNRYGCSLELILSRKLITQLLPARIIALRGTRHLIGHLPRRPPSPSYSYRLPHRVCFRLPSLGCWVCFDIGDRPCCVAVRIVDSVSTPSVTLLRSMPSSQ